MPVTLIVRDVRPSSDPSVDGESLTFDQSKIVIGRAAHADVRVPSRTVSETHAVLKLEASEISISDDGSTNGTLVNGSMLVRGRKKILKHGDVIGLPGFDITVQPPTGAVDPAGRTATVARRLLEASLGTAHDEQSPPELTLANGRDAGRRWLLDSRLRRLTAGRGDVCHIVLDDVDCSREHVEFVRDDYGVLLRDLGSKNGTYVGERRVDERRLRDGDTITVGRSTLRYHDPVEELMRAFDVGVDEPAKFAAGIGSGPSQPPPSALASAPGPSQVVASAPPPPSTRSRPPIPAQSSTPSRGRATGTADWIVIALAILILAISAAALYFVLKGTPSTH